MALAMPSHAQAISQILSSIERSNPALRSSSFEREALAAERRADVSLFGASEVEYSPFFQRNVSGVASSELIVSQEIEFPTRYLDNRRAVQHADEADRLNTLVLRRDVLLEAQQLCLDHYSARQTLQLISQRLAAADTLLHLVGLRYDRGDATILDLQRVKLDRMQVLKQQTSCEGQLKSCSLALQGLNGGISLDSLLALPLTFDDGVAVFSCATAEGCSSLEVRVADQAYVSSQSALRAQRREWLPSLTLGYRRNTELREAFGGFLVGLNFPLATTAKRQRAARSRMEAAQAEREMVQAASEQRVQGLRAEITALQRQMASYDLDLLNDNLKMLRRAVEGGELSLVDYYREADRNYDLLVERLEVENRLLRAIASLRREAL